MVGWGNAPAHTEFAPSGEIILCHSHLGASIFYSILDLGGVKSYRTFKSKWVGRPKEPPSIKAFAGQVFTSWNGATEVAKWRLESAKSVEATDGDFAIVEEVPKEAFETMFSTDSWERRFVRVAALDAAGEVPGYSAVVDSTISEPISTPLMQLLFGVLGVAAIVFLAWKYKEVRCKQSARTFPCFPQPKSSQQYEMLHANGRDDDDAV